MREERKLSEVELSERQMRVAMTDRTHLKQWLRESGRSWVIFDSDHLVDALPWPDGVEVFIQLVACYRDYRATVETGETQQVTNPETGRLEEMPFFHPETLTLVEMERAIQWLIQQIRDIDPNWDLSSVSS